MRHRRHGFSLLELLVAIFVIAVLMALLVPAVQRVRDAAARSQCANNLRQLGLGLHGFQGVHKVFPPGVSYRDGDDVYPFMNWHARILPFVEQEGLWNITVAAYAKDRVFWNNPPHVGFATVVATYGCPADSRTLAVGNARKMSVALSSYLGVEGTNQFRKDGMLFLDSRVRIVDVSDGTSTTLFVGERPPSADQGFGWWYAGWGQNKDGSADGVLGVREMKFGSFIPASCPPGPYSYGPGAFNNQCDTLHFWSPHFGGGAHFLFVDGSAHFVSYDAASLMPAMATRAGGDAHTSIP